MAACSILIPTYGRADALRKCLLALDQQTLPPDEIIAVWQEKDLITRDALQQMQSQLRVPLRIVHNPRRGVVPAENAALDAATGDIILLIDDDAVALPDFVERHLAHYRDPAVGAVGGPAINHRPDGSTFPTRDAQPIGKITWAGRLIGNMYDHPHDWRSRAPIDVDHLVGYNMSIRRSAFDRFESRLKPYWQMFELDACLQARQRGFRVVFDFGIVVDHFPTNAAYAGGRDGDLDVKIYNAAYNHALILAKHRGGLFQRAAQNAWAYGIGTVSMPGVAGALVGMIRYGRPARELRILWRTWKSRRSAGRKLAKSGGDR